MLEHQHAALKRCFQWGFSCSSTGPKSFHFITNMFWIFVMRGFITIIITIINNIVIIINIDIAVVVIISQFKSVGWVGKWTTPTTWTTSTTPSPLSSSSSSSSWCGGFSYSWILRSFICHHHHQGLIGKFLIPSTIIFVERWNSYLFHQFEF